MNVGRLTVAREVLVRLRVQGVRHVLDAEAVLDTGFNGYLALPPSWIEDLSLERIGQAEMMLASGEARSSHKYKATVRFGRETKPVEVIEAAEPLVGTQLLWGYRLHVDFKTGGRVEVEVLGIDA